MFRINFFLTLGKSPELSQLAKTEINIFMVVRV